MKKIKIVKFEEIQVQENSNRIILPKDTGEVKAISECLDIIERPKYFHEVVYDIVHYIDDKNGRVDFAITKEQEKIFKSFIMSKYNLYNITENYNSTLEELEAMTRLFKQEIKDNALLDKELTKYKTMNFWQRLNFLFAGMV